VPYIHHRRVEAAGAFDEHGKRDQPQVQASQVLLAIPWYLVVLDDAVDNETVFAASCHFRGRCSEEPGGDGREVNLKHKQNLWRSLLRRRARHNKSHIDLKEANNRGNDPFRVSVYPERQTSVDRPSCTECTDALVGDRNVAFRVLGASAAWRLEELMWAGPDLSRRSAFHRSMNDFGQAHGFLRENGCFLEHLHLAEKKVQTRRERLGHPDQSGEA
jgi:hypothetical protein